jgi:hypothetical protein
MTGGALGWSYWWEGVLAGFRSNCVRYVLRRSEIRMEALTIVHAATGYEAVPVWPLPFTTAKPLSVC